MQGGRLDLFRVPHWVVLVKVWAQVRAPLHRALLVKARAQVLVRALGNRTPCGKEPMLVA